MDVDPRATAVLQEIAVAARDAVGRFDQMHQADAEATYRRLRVAAAELNSEHSWMPREEFDTMLPTLETRMEMDEMNAQVASTTLAPSPIQDLLRALWAWARGVSYYWRRTTSSDHPVHPHTRSLLSRS